MTTKNSNLATNLKSIPFYMGIGLLGLFSLAGCDKDDSGIEGSNEGIIAISAKGKYADPTGKASITAKDVSATMVQLSTFAINVKEFELEFAMDDGDDDDTNTNGDGRIDYEDEIELKGPFELDLLQGEDAFITATVPLGTYEEIEFEISKGTDSNSDLFGKSVLIKGNIGTVPFVLWHDFDEDLEVDFDDPTVNITVTNNTTDLTIGFDLSLLINEVNGIDLSQALDGNGDGTIEISPVDTDGNQAIAQQLKVKLKDIIDLLDD